MVALGRLLAHSVLSLMNYPNYCSNQMLCAEEFVLEFVLWNFQSQHESTYVDHGAFLGVSSFK